jgi:phosphoenolpyruvate-protein kinase (PTS system EI component)
VRAQAEAIGRLASRFPLAVLVPFITDRREFRLRRSAILERLPAPIPVGPVAETPAGALALTELARDGDLVAVGCNDLLQCLFAADRGLPEVAPLVDPYAPSVFRFLRLVAREAGDALERVVLCGLLAQIPGLLPVLIGLGFRAFSVEPLLIPPLAASVAATGTTAAARLAREVCAAPDASDVRLLLDLPADRRWAPSTDTPSS